MGYMKSAEEVLREYTNFDDVNGDEAVELLPLTIVDIMIEYADMACKQQRNNCAVEWSRGGFENEAAEARAIMNAPTPDLT